MAASPKTKKMEVSKGNIEVGTVFDIIGNFFPVIDDRQSDLFNALLMSDLVNIPEIQKLISKLVPAVVIRNSPPIEAILQYFASEVANSTSDALVDQEVANNPKRQRIES